MTEQQRERVDINWVQVSGSALAAVTSAVLLSTVGVAGTIIGAAIGSVFATAGSAIYSYSLRISRDRVAAAQAAALERVTRARSGASGAWADSRAHNGGTTTLQAERAVDELDHAEQQLEQTAPKPSWRDVLAGLRWKRIAAVAGGIFVVAMLVIVSFELLTGRAVSSYTGGSDQGARTSIPGVGAKRTGGTPDKTPAPTQQPSSGESTPAPSSTPTPSETATPTPTPTPTPSPSDAATAAPQTTAPSTVPTPVATPPTATPAG